MQVSRSLDKDESVLAGTQIRKYEPANIHSLNYSSYLLTLIGREMDLCVET